MQRDLFGGWTSRPSQWRTLRIKILELVMSGNTGLFSRYLEIYCQLQEKLYSGASVLYRYRRNLKKWFLGITPEIFRNMENSKEKEAGSIIDKAKDYIHDNFQRDISLDDVSREVVISPYYFSKLFKQETEELFSSILQKYVSKNARELLKDSRLSIKEICTESGYSDPNYFSRIFKKYEGVTPSEFRERLR